uniref:hypothetical protein n=1 Tax=Thaumasiovibrio occultus TaxID=1891184 RepID=UPI000B3609BD|nr:hypothetical protein [Thaumasiovibrio occultus]
MKKYLALLLCLLPLTTSANWAEEIEKEGMEYLEEHMRNLRQAELALLQLTEDKDYPWDPVNRPFENYDDENDPPLTIEQAASIELFDDARGVLEVSIANASLIHNSEYQEEQISWQTKIYERVAEDGDPVDIIAHKFALDNWQLYSDSPETYLRALWSELLSIDIAEYTQYYDADEYYAEEDYEDDHDEEYDDEDSGFW